MPTTPPANGDLPLAGTPATPAPAQVHHQPAHGRHGATADPDTVAHLWPGPRFTAAEQVEAGRTARKEVPRSAHAEVGMPPERDPLAILAAQATSRVPELVPVRHARMAVSPFTFFRGAAAVMAADLAASPTTPMHVQACGDAHLLNFGLFATPERHLAFDVNDFDETLPGPFEWDVKRLAASVAIAAGDRGFTDSQQRAATRAATASYQRSVASLAELDEMASWYTQVNVDQLVPMLRGPMRKEGTRVLDKARRRTSWSALAKMTTNDAGTIRIVDDPPLITHLDDADVVDHVTSLVETYLPTLSSDRRALLRRFRVVDVARKVVGVGSVGTRCYVVLLASYRDDTPLFLQVKEAEASVLEAHVGRARQHTSGERVVDGQRLMQASSDIFLGWATVGPYHFYVRQLRDMKGSVEIERLDPDRLVSYAESCGYALARSHARSGLITAVNAYLGKGDTFPDAITEFAMRYAELNATDHAAMVQAIADGRMASATHA